MSLISAVFHEEVINSLTNSCSILAVEKALSFILGRELCCTDRMRWGICWCCPSGFRVAKVLLFPWPDSEAGEMSSFMSCHGAISVFLWDILWEASCCHTWGQIFSLHFSKAFIKSSPVLFIQDQVSPDAAEKWLQIPSTVRQAHREAAPLPHQWCGN